MTSDVIEVEATSTALQAADNALTQAAAQWLQELDVLPRTRSNYSKAIGRYLDFLTATGLQGSEVSDLMAYKARLADAYSANTINTYLVPVRGFYKWLSARIAGVNPAANLKGAKPSRGFKKDALTPDQALTLLRHASQDGTLKGKRNTAILYLLLHTALRTIEVARANVEDLRPQGNVTVLWVQGKGREEKDSYVVIPPAVEERLRDYLSARGQVEDSDPLFASLSHRNGGERMTTRSISRLVKDALVEAGFNSSRLTAHSMRHTAVTLSLIAGATPQEAQAMARHSNISTTMIYAHNIERTKNPAENRVADLLASA